MPGLGLDVTRGILKLEERISSPRLILLLRKSRHQSMSFQGEESKMSLDVSLSLGTLQHSKFISSLIKNLINI